MIAGAVGVRSTGTLVGATVIGAAKGALIGAGIGAATGALGGAIGAGVSGTSGTEFLEHGWTRRSYGVRNWIDNRRNNRWHSRL